jgi:hypothetical protein
VDSIERLRASNYESKMFLSIILHAERRMRAEFFDVYLSLGFIPFHWRAPRRGDGEAAAETVSTLSDSDRFLQ